MMIIDVCAAVIASDGKILVTSRPEGKTMAGFWEFPGGKLESGERHADCLRREIYEELGAEIEPGDFIALLTHVREETTIRLHFYFAVLAFGSQPFPRENQQMRWVLPSELRTIPLLPADQPLIAFLDSEKRG